MILLSGVQGSNLRRASGFKVNRFGLSLGSLLSAISLSLALFFAIPASAQNDINIRLAPLEERVLYLETRRSQ